MALFATYDSDHQQLLFYLLDTTFLAIYDVFSSCVSVLDPPLIVSNTFATIP